MFEATVWWVSSAAPAHRRCTRMCRSALALPYAWSRIPGRTSTLPSFRNSNDLRKQSYASRRGTLRTFEVQLTSGMNQVNATIASDALANLNIVEMQLVSEMRVLSSSSGFVVIFPDANVRDGVRGSDASSSSIDLARVAVANDWFSCLNRTTADSRS